MSNSASTARSVFSKLNFFTNISTYSIKRKVTLLVVSVVLLSMLFAGAYSYSIIQNILEENIHNELSRATQQTNASLESTGKVIENTAMLLLCNQIIKSNLEQAGMEGSAYQKSRIKLRIEDELKYSLLFNPIWDSNLLKSVFIFKDEFTFFYLSRDLFPNRSFIDDHINFYNLMKNDTSHSNLISPSAKYPILFYMMDVKDQSTLTSIGKLVLGIDQKEFMKLYQPISQFPHSQAFITNQKGVIISHTDTNMIGRMANDKFQDIKPSLSISELELEGRMYFVSSQRNNNLKLSSVVIIPKKQVMHRLDDNIKSFLLIMVFAVAIALTISLYLTSKITQPIQSLISKLNMMKEGSFNVKMPPYSEYELNELSTVFNKMTDQIQYLFQQVYEKQLLIKESELQLLQSQVNPHFLFNVLETISWEARLTKSDKIYQMIVSLGQLLRASITTNTKEKITVREELKYIEFYLYLQKIRFGDHLHVQILVPENLPPDCYLPKLCIQPIVENAIIHGLERKRGNKSLTIRVAYGENRITFEVSDDGVGFDPTLIDLNDKDSIEYRKEGHTSIGLYNSHKRIRLLYGDAYGVSVHSILGAGTTVNVSIPMDRSEH